MATKSLKQWRDQVFNKKIDLDNQSYDCVDVPKSWAEYLTGLPWTTSFCWGNAKDLYANCPTAYWSKLPRGNTPKVGDVIVMGAGVGGGYGHTGAVVAVDGGNVTIYEQNTFTQAPVKTGVWSWNVSYVIGLLRPKVAFSVDTALQSWQRTLTAKEGVNQRDKPTTVGSKVIKTWAYDPSDNVYDFKGYVRGEKIEGNENWFVGRHSGGYFTATAFNDKTTKGLPDLTPKAPTLPTNQRQVGIDAMNIRKSPQLLTDNTVRTAQPSEIVTIKGYVKGQTVEGSNVWFVLADGNYTWAAGYTNTSLTGLTDLTKTEPPVTPIQYPAPTNDSSVTRVINKKNPNNPLNYAPSDLQSINGQQLRKEAKEALTMLINAASREDVTVSPASGYRSYDKQKQVYDSYVQNDGQAAADTYSARPGYSEHQTGLAIDFSPIEESFETTPVYAWLKANAHKFGYTLRYPKGSESVTGYIFEPWHWRYIGVTAATDIFNKKSKSLEEYFGIQGGDYGTIENPDDTTEPSDLDKENNVLLKQILAIVQWIKDKLVGVFK